MITGLDIEISTNKTKATFEFRRLSAYYQDQWKFHRLGIYLNEKLNFQRHIRELIADVEKRLNVLKMLDGSKWGGHPETLLMVLKSVVREKTDYGSTIYANTNQNLLNKVTVAYHKGLRICLRSLKTTIISAMEDEAGSTRLKLRSDFLSRKEVLKIFERNFPLTKKLNDILNHQDDYGLTFLEASALWISDLLNSICNVNVKSTVSKIETLEQYKHIL